MSTTHVTTSAWSAQPGLSRPDTRSDDTDFVIARSVTPLIASLVAFLIMFAIRQATPQKG